MSDEQLVAFVRESNRIEGIFREPSSAEVAAHRAFVALARLSIGDVEVLVGILQPGAELRDQDGMDVRVGSHIAPRGSPAIARSLADLLRRINTGALTPFAAHIQYETLHPFMDGNGRSGRAIWLWMMRGDAPLGFLHRFYYQTLDARQGRA